jgi:tyrosinase
MDLAWRLVMTLSRRNLLLQGCAVGAGVIAANMPGMVALAQAGPFLRRSLQGMALDDPILQAWRDGVRQLKAATSGNITWGGFAAIHGNASQFNLCPHGNWYFLPWHRAYLLMYERVVRQLTGQNDFALPYWDWTQERQIPRAFVEPTFNGQPNALFEAQRDATPTDSLDDNIVGQGVIAQILSETPFETFGTSRPVGQNNTDQSWINCEFCGTFGTLEATPHNLVHTFVGGLMGQSNSALDPIFMMHHCNIDRIWWMWNQGAQADSPDPLWTGMTFQNNFVNPDGTPYAPSVSDLLVPEPLGYTYSDTPTPATPTATASPRVVEYQEKLKSLYTVPNLTGARAAGVATYVAENSQTATPGKYLEVPVDVNANALNTVARGVSTPSGSEVLDLRKVRERHASGARAYVFIRDIAFTEHANTEYRVFINCPDLSSYTPTTNRHYVGAFGFFGSHGGHSGKESRKPSVALDLTSAIQRVFSGAVVTTAGLRVQLQPVALRKSGKTSGTATPNRVEVAIVSA